MRSLRNMHRCVPLHNVIMINLFNCLAFFIVCELLYSRASQKESVCRK